MKNKTILVTGGLGYIGSHTVVELQQQGYNVIVLDNLSNSNEIVAERIERITGEPVSLYVSDVGNRKALYEIFEFKDIDAVIHFAAYKAVGESVEKPIKYYRNNIGGMINLLAGMNKFEVKTLIFSSSCTVYGDSKFSPLDENAPVIEAASPYGSTKIIGEQLLKDISRHSGIQGVSLRYFNPVGAHPSAKIGELPIGTPSNLVPFITQTAAGIREQLTVFGNDYNTMDGTNIRDFIHVCDLARAHVKAMEYAFEMKDKYDVFNLGTGKGHSVLEVIRAFEKVSGKTLPFEFGERRPGDVEQIWADARKANELLGWSCEYSLDDMMRTAWNWQKTLLTQHQG